MLRLADQATDRVIKVDDFDPDELAAKQLHARWTEPAPRSKRTDDAPNRRCRSRPTGASSSISRVSAG